MPASGRSGSAPTSTRGTTSRARARSGRSSAPRLGHPNRRLRVDASPGQPRRGRAPPST
jgi:hypothetical protein